MKDVAQRRTKRGSKNTYKKSHLQGAISLFLPASSERLPTRFAPHRHFRHSLKKLAKIFRHLPLPAVSEPIWLEPLPDDWIATPEQEPHARYSQRESVSLAFLAALQYLPPRQRAVLLLSDVLEWRANEIAQQLDLTTAAVNSALHRARETMQKHYPAQGRVSLQTTDEQTRVLVARYVRAWENMDVAGLVNLLAKDARLSMPPTSSWYQGRRAIQEMLSAMAFSSAARDTWRLIPTRANRLPALAMYHRVADQNLQPFGVMVLECSARQIEQVIVFMTPVLVRRFA